MKVDLKKENAPKYITWMILGLCVVVVLILTAAMFGVYNSGHDLTDTDKTADINVMITRPDNWERIQTGKISLTREDFALIDGSTATIPITAELARQFCNASDEKIWEYVDHNTTHDAYENLILTNGDPDKIQYMEKIDKYRYDSRLTFEQKRLLFVTEPSKRELYDAQNEGVTFDITPVALDGFVFITHKDNPIDSLTVEQIQKIYSGKITNWKEVGGNDQRIIPYQRNSGSGSQTAMEQLVMKNVPLMEPVGYSKESLTLGLMSELVKKIAEYENRENSLGYTYYYYINNLYRNDDIKVLKINGVSPDNENLISGEYPFSTAYYMVMAKDRNDSQTAKMRELRDYLLTDEGQEIIKMAGYCPIGRR
ncbi:MAG: substrate-binding domain-containing protein [Oscillospiraceae bacterium]|nr:substrate-binding domain-containing protein [Oscillospiraceae bacterium]